MKDSAEKYWKFWALFFLFVFFIWFYCLLKTTSNNSYDNSDIRYPSEYEQRDGNTWGD